LFFVALDLSVVGNAGIVFVCKTSACLPHGLVTRTYKYVILTAKSKWLTGLGERKQERFVQELQFEENENKTALTLKRRTTYEDVAQ
jgi:hypothetical protein